MCRCMCMRCCASMGPSYLHACTYVEAPLSGITLSESLGQQTPSCLLVVPAPSVCSKHFTGVCMTGSPGGCLLNFWTPVSACMGEGWLALGHKYSPVSMIAVAKHSPVSIIAVVVFDLGRPGLQVACTAVTPITCCLCTSDVCCRTLFSQGRVSAAWGGARGVQQLSQTADVFGGSEVDPG